MKYQIIVCIGCQQFTFNDVVEYQMQGENVLWFKEYDGTIHMTTILNSLITRKSSDDD